MARPTWEVYDFLVHGVGKTIWPGRFDKRLAIHDSWDAFEASSQGEKTEWTDTGFVFHGALCFIGNITFSLAGGDDGSSCRGLLAVEISAHQVASRLDAPEMAWWRIPPLAEDTERRPSRCLIARLSSNVLMTHWSRAARKFQCPTIILSLLWSSRDRTKIDCPLPT